MNIVIGRPVLESVSAESEFSLVNMLFYSNAHNLHFMPSIGTTVIHESRNNIIYNAYATSFDYVLMIDSDMVFPPHTLEKLIAADVDICGVLYRAKTEDKQNVFSYDEQRDDFVRTTIKPDQGVVEVGAVGSGIILIKKKVLDTIGSPWFFYEIGIGEDVNFCKVAKERGFKTYVNTDIDVYHIAKEKKGIKRN